MADRLITRDAVSDAEPPRGRPLDPSRDIALRAVVLDLLAEVGYDRVTMEAVAARARASKATIYRRWSGKAELVVDALRCMTGDSVLPDTGSLRGDLEAMARQSAGTADQFDVQLRVGLITALARDADLRQVFRERFVEPRDAALKVVFQRAVSRGEIAERRNLDLLVSLFPALMFQHLLIFGEAPGSRFAERVVSDVILPLATAPDSARPRRLSHRRSRI